MRQGTPPLTQRGLAKLKRWSARLLQKVPLSVGVELDPERWIFVVGCYNSGTSLLAQILAAHPSVGGLPDEGIFYTDALPYPEQFGWPRIWIRCLDELRLHPEAVSADTIRRIKKQWSLFYPRHTPNLVEKSVVNAVRMPFLQAHFQPAYFISIVRNGFAVAEGIRRRATPSDWNNPEFGDSYPIELCAEQWLRCDELITSDARSLERFMQVRYEELTVDPAEVMRRVTDFLGLTEVDPTVFDQSWMVRDKYETIQDMNARSFRRLSVEDVKAIERIAKDSLLKYGYTAPQSEDRAIGR